MKLLIPLILLLFACSTDNNENSINRGSIIRVKEKTLENLKQPYNIAYIDSMNGNNQRIFIVLPEKHVYNDSLVKEIICNLSMDSLIQTNTSVSFFTEKKWANYKDVIFPNLNTPKGLSKSENKVYNKWLENYYFGEFDNSKRTYKTYPTSNETNKKKTLIIEKCT